MVNQESNSDFSSGWWFQTFSFHNIWDNPSHWLTFFKLVKTTSQSWGSWSHGDHLVTGPLTTTYDVLPWRGQPFYPPWYHHFVNCNNHHASTMNSPFDHHLSQPPNGWFMLLITYVAVSLNTVLGTLDHRHFERHSKHTQKHRPKHRFET